MSVDAEVAAANAVNTTVNSTIAGETSVLSTNGRYNLLLQTSSHRRTHAHCRHRISFVPLYAPNSDTCTTYCAAKVRLLFFIHYVRLPFVAIWFGSWESFIRLQFFRTSSVNGDGRVGDVAGDKPGNWRRHVSWHSGELNLNNFTFKGAIPLSGFCKWCTVNFALTNLKGPIRWSEISVTLGSARAKFFCT